MKAVVQRVTDASVRVAGEIKGSISCGLLVYLGVAQDDTEADADWLAEKILQLRIFDDESGVMNISLLAIVNQVKKMVNEAVNLANSEVNENNSENGNTTGGISAANAGILVISQFTLLGDVKKGRRPSWAKAATPEKARQLYEYFIRLIKNRNLKCESGEFQAKMLVSYTNNGPVTILLDSKE